MLGRTPQTRQHDAKEVREVMRRETLTRKQLLAAELHAYSYANYADHLGIGNIRFDKLMPRDVDTLEQAEREGWDSTRLAQALEIPEDQVAAYRRSYREAKDIVDAPTLAESFRRAIRYVIQSAIEEGLTDEAARERLITQVCYRVADLSFRLEMEGKQLAEYSRELRQETKYDGEALRKRLDQEIQERTDSQKRGGAA